MNPDRPSGKLSVATRNRLIDEGFAEVHEHLRLLHAQAKLIQEQRKNTLLLERVKATKADLRRLQRLVLRLQRYAIAPARLNVSPQVRRTLEDAKSLRRLVKLRTMGVNKRMRGDFLKVYVEQELDRLDMVGE